MSASASNRRAHEIITELHSVNSEIARLQRTQKRMTQGPALGVRCNVTLRVAFAILALTTPETKFAVAYLAFKRRNKSDADDWTEEILLSRFSELSETTKHRLLRPVTAEEQRCYQKASDWIREQRARDWVTEQNVSKGLAPGNKHLWAKMLALEEQDENRGRTLPHLKHIVKLRSKNQWLHRWAKRCRIRKGRFKDGEKLEVESLQAKAGWADCGQQFGRIRTQKWSPKWCPFSGLKIGTVLQNYNNSCAHFSGPFSGPHFASQMRFCAPSF